MRQPSKRIAERRSTAKTRKAFRLGDGVSSENRETHESRCSKKNERLEEGRPKGQCPKHCGKKLCRSGGLSPKTDLSSKRRPDQKDNERLVIRASQLKTVDKNWRNGSNQQHRVAVWKRQLASPPPEKGDERHAQKGREKCPRKIKGRERARNTRDPVNQDGTLRRARREEGPLAPWYAALLPSGAFSKSWNSDRLPRRSDNAVEHASFGNSSPDPRNISARPRKPASSSNSSRQGQRQPHRQPAPGRRLPQNSHLTSARPNILWRPACEVPIFCGFWQNFVQKTVVGDAWLRLGSRATIVCCSNSSNLDVRRTKLFAEIRKIRRLQD